MSQYPITDRNQVKRAPKRGHYDKATVYRILDEASICHVAFNFNGKPYIIPTIFGRKNDTIYLHGAVANRMLNAIDGADISIGVTHLDGLVLARSIFHHSMNYRSVILYGKGQLVEDINEKMEAFYVISEQVLKGRWDEARVPNKLEIKSTKVVKVEIDEASAKIRTGGPVDEPEDYKLDVWAGVLPTKQIFESPVKDEKETRDIDLPKSIQRAGF